MVKNYIKTKKRYKKTIKKRLARKRLSRKRLTRKRLTKHNYKKNKIKKGGKPSYTLKEDEFNKEILEKKIRDAAAIQQAKILGKKVVKEVGEVARSTTTDAIKNAVPGSEAVITAVKNITGRIEKSQNEINNDIIEKLNNMDNKLNELLGRGSSGYTGNSTNLDSEEPSE